MNEKVVVLNAGKMNYDGRLDFSGLALDTEGKTAREVTVYEDSLTCAEDGGAQILERVRDAAAVVTKELVLTEAVLGQFPDSVRLIVEAGTGYNNIPLDTARAKGITVCNVPAYSSERVAHTAVMLLLNLSSSMRQQISMLAAGDRRNFTEHLLVPHVEVNGKTLGVIGAGNIGRKVIAIARALDMKVLVYTRTVPPAETQTDPMVVYTSREEVLRNCDYLSLHCPLSAATRHLIGREELAMMKPSAFLINTSRGALIDEAALIEALQNGVIAGAGLDVQETEPPAADNPLYTMDNVILTPHMGWKGMETRERLVGVVAGDVQSFFAGTPVNVVS